MFRKIEADCYLMVDVDDIYLAIDVKNIGDLILNEWLLEKDCSLHILSKTKCNFIIW